MRNLVQQFEQLFENHDGFKRNAENYTRAIKTEEWKFLKDAILMIRGQMATDMFSKAHTDSDPTEKDVTQRTYYHINQILDFLLNPVDWVNRKRTLRQKFADQLNKVSRNRKEGNK
ncbi:MAG: hypothetical protein ACFFCW_00310 [Candidatus Hodarchaeota archaeon]